MRKITFSLLFLITFFSIVFTVYGAGAGDRSDQPITIKSNELYSDSKTRTAVFTGKVVAKQQDVTIFADKLVVHYTEQGGQVDRVEATGNVRIVQLNRIGTAGRAVYENKEGKITLYDSPRVKQGKDVVSGKEITYFIGEDKSVVTGGPGARVEAVIFPKSRGKDGERGSKTNP
jgi:lipopolysaccharide export system protein LptA